MNLVIKMIVPQGVGVSNKEYLKTLENYTFPIPRVGEYITLQNISFKVDSVMYDIDANSVNITTNIEDVKRKFIILNNAIIEKLSFKIISNTIEAKLDYSEFVLKYRAQDIFHALNSSGVIHNVIRVFDFFKREGCYNLGCLKNIERRFPYPKILIKKYLEKTSFDIEKDIDYVLSFIENEHFTSDKFRKENPEHSEHMIKNLNIAHFNIIKQIFINLKTYLDNDFTSNLETPPEFSYSQT